MLDVSLKTTSLKPANSAKPLRDTDWGQVTCRIASGDRDALSIYYQHFFDLLFLEAMRVTHLDESTCLDIVQDSMLKIIRSMRKIDDRNRLVAWSRAVVKNSAYDWLRKKQREQKLITSLSHATSDVQFDDNLEISARITWLEQQLTELPPEVQKLFSMRYRMGWTLKKIANSLGMQTGTVDGKLRRAVEKLKAKAEVEKLD